LLLIEPIKKRFIKAGTALAKNLWGRQTLLFAFR